MHLRYVTYILILLLAFVHALPSTLSTTFELGQLVPRNPVNPSRDIILAFYFEDTPRLVNGRELYLPHHSALWIKGTDHDGPLKIEVAIKENDDFFVRVLDMTKQRAEHDPKGKGGGPAEVVGQTRVRNEAFFNPKTGRGLIYNSVGTDPKTSQYRSGPENRDNLNTCHDVNNRIVQKLGGKLTPLAQKLFDEYDEYSKAHGENVKHEIERIKTWYAAAEDNGPPVPDRTYTFGNTKCDDHPKRDGACQGKIEDNKDLKAGSNELITDPKASSFSQASLEIEDTDKIDGKYLAKANIGEAGKLSKFATVRAEGKVAAFTVVGREALSVLGAAGTVAGAVFVILDFVDKQWVAGAIGAVAVGATLAATLATGPVGWVIGGIAVTLFLSKFLSSSLMNSSIAGVSPCLATLNQGTRRRAASRLTFSQVLPGLYKEMHPPADRTDTKGIIQWKMFGDKGHTGNGSNPSPSKFPLRQY